MFTETPLELELRFKSKSSAGTGSAASHRKRSNSFSDDDEYEIEYPRKKQRTSPVASPVESVVASTRRKVKTEGTESNGHIQNTKRTYDAFQPDHKTYMQPQRQAYQAQQYVDAPQVPLVPNYYWVAMITRSSDPLLVSCITSHKLITTTAALRTAINITRITHRRQ